MSDPIGIKNKTITERTLLKNLKMYRQHINKAKKELLLKNGESPDIVSIIKYYIEQFATMRSGTMNNYRANLITGLRWSIDQRNIGQEALEILSKYDPTKDEKRLEFIEQGGSDRLFKKKSLGDKNIKVLIRVCKNMTVKAGDRIITYYNIATHTGLRPSEWANAKLVTGDDCVMLQVLNGKNTNGRSLGSEEPYRYLRLKDELIAPAEEWLKYINDAIKKVVDQEKQDSSEHRKEATDMLYHAMGLQITNSIKKLELSDEVKKLMPTFYTTRHYFTDVLIHSQITRVEIAYLLGHGSVSTHLQHYGRANSKVRNKTKVRSGRKGGGFPKKIINSEKEFLQKHPIQSSNTEKFGWAHKDIKVKGAVIKQAKL